MNDNIKRKIKSLYALAMHPATGKDEAETAKKLLDNMLSKYNAKIEDIIGQNPKDSEVTWHSLTHYENDVRWLNTVAAFFAKRHESIVLCALNRVFKFSSKHACDTVGKVLDFHGEFLRRAKIKPKQVKDYNSGFTTGLLMQENEKAMAMRQEKENSTNESSDKLITVSQSISLDNILDQETSPLTSDDILDGKIDDTIAWIIGLKDGKKTSQLLDINHALSAMSDQLGPDLRCLTS